MYCMYLINLIFSLASQNLKNKYQAKKLNLLFPLYICMCPLPLPNAERILIYCKLFKCKSNKFLQTLRSKVGKTPPHLQIGIKFFQLKIILKLFTNFTCSECIFHTDQSFSAEIFSATKKLFLALFE